MAVSVEELKKAIKDILKGADLDNLSTKKVRKELEEKFDTDLTKRKKEIDALVMQMITENEEEEEEQKQDQQSDSEGINGAEDSDLEEEVPKKKAKKSSSSKMNDEDLARKLQEEEESRGRTRGSRRPPPPPKKEKKKKVKDQDPSDKKKTGYMKPVQLSEKLAAIVGVNEMPRSEVVKTLWGIIKERDLKDPKNGQFMKCDEQFYDLFGRKTVRIFGMMKYLTQHFINPDDIVDNE